MNNPSRLTRRTLRAVGLTCSVFALTLSAGCAGDSSGDSGGKTVIRFNWWGSDSRHEMTKQMIAVFEKEHPNIKVPPEYSNWDDYWKKLSTGAAAGDMPDVLQITDPFMYSYIDNGQLMDLKKVQDVLHTDKLPANSMTMTTVKGGLYGVPAGESAFGIAADPATFKKAGVPLPDDTKWSWDDYVKTSQAVSKTKGLVGTVMPLYPNDLGPWLRQHGEDYWSEDGSRIGFTEGTMAAYWEWVVKLRDSGGTTSAEAAVEQLSSGAGVEQSLVAQHKAAMTDVSVTQLGALEGASGRETKLLLFPGENGASQVGAYSKPGIFFGASAKTEHPQGGGGAARLPGQLSRGGQDPEVRPRRSRQPGRAEGDHASAVAHGEADRRLPGPGQRPEADRPAHPQREGRSRRPGDLPAPQRGRAVQPSVAEGGGQEVHLRDHVPALSGHLS
jgi:multiple sugar transport system substrate-binding protein